ncbi:uncharacterized protein LOC106021754 [Mesocricetus auratus]|uniref:Uncharacterized protein LOC106021754 n=1 Tax=Mesocricetus auratus TaxID=10036 RepID=A0ABM2WAA6_MESAU|nr:uncharacterized protein LOC106021754 [Mesocricetus auratus]
MPVCPDARRSPAASLKAWCLRLNSACRRDVQRILPAPRGSAAGPGGGARRGAGLRLRLGDAHPRPRHARSLGSPEPRGPGAPGSLGRDGALEVGLPRVTAECRLSGPPGPEVAGESRPGSDKLPRHLPDKVSSTSSSSGAGPRREGWGSRPQLPLFSQISAPTSPSRAGPDGYPRPAPRCPAAAASSRPRRGCAGVRATLLRATEGSAGSGAAGVGGCAVRARGSLPGPAVPAANCAWSDGCRCGGKLRESMSLEPGNLEVISEHEIPKVLSFKVLKPCSQHPVQKVPEKKLNGLFSSRAPVAPSKLGKGIALIGREVISSKLGCMQERPRAKNAGLHSTEARPYCREGVATRVWGTETVRFSRRCATQRCRAESPPLARSHRLLQTRRCF